MKISLTELRQILRDSAELEALRLERAALKQQILDLLAGDEAVHSKATAIFDKSETVEDKMRTVVAGRSE